MIEKQNKQINDDSVDLREVIKVVWLAKWIIIFFVFICTLASVFYALSLPNIYKSEVTLAPVSENSSMRVPGQLGGLAALAGVSIGASGPDKTSIAIEVLKSRNFIGDFVEKHDLYATVMAVTEWNSAENKIIFNSELYDSTNSKWVRKVSYPFLPKPSRLEAYSAFNSIFSVSQDKTSGLIKVSVEHLSPFVAKNILDLLITEINEEMRQRDLSEASHSITYLNQQISQTNLSEARTMLYSLVEEQTKVLMLGNVRSEYVFKTLDPAVVAEAKSKPRRSVIVLLTAVLATLLSTLLVLLRHFIRK